MLAGADARAVPDRLANGRVLAHALAVGPDKEEITHAEREKARPKSDIQDSSIKTKPLLRALGSYPVSTAQDR
jgi:hypothetical protein